MGIPRSGGGEGPDRLPPMTVDALSEAQSNAAARFAEARKAPVFGPFWPLIRSPEMMLRAHEMGQYLRYNSSLPYILSEMAILLIARRWNQPVEWDIHLPAALKAGLSAAVAESIRLGRRPDEMSPQEAVVHDLVEALQPPGVVDDALYARGCALLGEAGVIDLAGVAGYYSLLAMTMNLARTKTAGADVPTLA